MAKKRYAHVGIGGRARMYYEAIQQALPDVKLYIDMSDGDTQKLLPLENFVTQGDKQ